jgi:hypothetical protein
VENVRIERAVERLKDVYRASPDAALTLTEASAVSGLDPESCQAVLDALADADVVERRDDLFVRSARYDAPAAKKPTNHA